MDLLEFKKLSDHYPIKKVMEVKEIGNGNTSNAKLVITMDGSYILRKVRDTKQAITEFLISKALLKQNISPNILLSNHQLPYMNEREDVYNLQLYIENQQDKNKEIDFYHLGKTISIFHSISKSIEGIYEQDDRFVLDRMWMELIQMEEFNNLECKTQLINMFEECLNYNHNNNCYIHGDLGIWNLLFCHSQIYIIDFGEVRKGNNHFDISAVISSTIDWNQGKDKIITSLNDFKYGYISNFETFSWKVLKENLSLWFTRGIIALFINHGINDRTCDYVKLTLERKNIVDRILNNNFL
ncbi:MAG: phosphotransferase [Heyndrickxia sp.]